jgi:uncharacterized protein YcaQ
MPEYTIKRLRSHAINRSLFRPTTLARAVKRLGFIQADPIRSPARAQDLILRHRVEGYRAGDLERRYPRMALEEDVLYAYGFVPRPVGERIREPDPKGLSRLEADVLEAVREQGQTHPRDLDEQFGRQTVTNAWGGVSKASKRALERLHRRGLLRVARRDNGIRVYAPAPDAAHAASPIERFRDLVMTAANIFAPAARTRMVTALAPVRRRFSIDARTARGVVDDLVDAGELSSATVDGVCFVWPAGRTPAKSGERAVRFLAPFDPLVWDRLRFEQFWGWSYKFEAYTPKAKRVRGYYAMPMLWGEDIIGWANVNNDDEQIDVDVGFVGKRPRGRPFTSALEAEIERMRVFLTAR